MTLLSFRRTEEASELPKEIHGSSLRGKIFKVMLVASLSLFFDAMLSEVGLAEPVDQSHDWAPVVQKLQAQLENLEDRIRDLQQRLVRIEKELSAPIDDADESSPIDQSRILLSKRKQEWQRLLPGWQVTVLSLSPANAVEKDSILGQFVSRHDRLALSEGEAGLGEKWESPVLYRRRGILWADQAGWYRLGIELTFPPRGYASFLGGFYCQVEIVLNGSEMLSRRLRMPYGEQGRVKRAVNSRRLEQGVHYIEQKIQCLPDGRQAANPMPAWGAIRVRSLLATPGSRNASLLREGSMRQPDARNWPVNGKDR